jgi:translocation and assembly module TamB
LKGVLSLSGQLKGNWENPEVMGSAFIDNGLLRVRDFPQSFEQIRADLLFSHKKIVVNSASGQLGGGPFSADGKIQVKKINDVLIDVKGRFKDISLTIPDGVKTKGSGDFFLKGNWFPYSLGGEYQVSQGEVSKEIDGNAQKAGKIKPSTFLPDFLIEDKFQPFLLDWNVILKRPILVKNSLVNSPLSGSLKVSGEISEPSLKGQLSLEKDGKVFFHETPFDVAIGQVVFSGDDVDNPNIFLNASARVKDEYDINLLIQGRAKDPQFNLSSQPPLAESEIISLLALGIKPKSDSDSKEFQTGELATQTTLQIGSALLQKPLGDINKLTGVEVDVSGATGADQAVVPNLTLKKQWTPKFGISASRTVENNPTNNAKIEYKVNKKLSVIGTWENKEGNPEIKDTSTEKVGVDLEYRLEFR